MAELGKLGFFGLGPIGRNLACNALDKGLSISAFDEDDCRRGAFLEALGPEASVRMAASEKELVAGLLRPRVLLFCDPSTYPVDPALPRLLGLLEAGDILVDAGDSDYRDSEPRSAALAARGVHFVALGLSGGAEGALRGPSLMAGGSAEAWPRLRPLLESLAARAPSGEPCCDWLGPGGVGHFVKMVHNAVEYADMELLAETYHLLKTGYKAGQDELASIFAEWGRGELSSYLLAITAEILAAREEGAPLLDKILDTAAQRGTGARAVEEALELGVPCPIFAESVFARSLSARKDERMAASAVLTGPKSPPSGERSAMIEEVRRALLGAKIVAYAEGFSLLAAASAEHGWNLDLGRIARLWREGSIIRSPFLDRIAEAYRRNPAVDSFLLDTSITTMLEHSLPSLRKVAARSLEAGIPVPAFAAAISFFDGYRSTWLPANLLQALRDRFGGHGYERVDRPRGEIHHASWK